MKHHRIICMILALLTFLMVVGCAYDPTTEKDADQSTNKSEESSTVVLGSTTGVSTTNQSEESSAAVPESTTGASTTNQSEESSTAVPESTTGIRTNENEKSDTPTSGSLYVNGKAVEGVSNFISSTDVRLPFLKTVQALGMIVVTQNDVVHVTNGDDVYILYYSPHVSFVKQGDTGNNIMLAPPGSTSYYCRYESNDVVLDSKTLEEVLWLMGVEVDISIDYTTSTATIVTR